METRISLKSRLFATGFLALVLGGSVMLGGCGSVNNAINSIIPDINNLVKLDGRSLSATVGSGRAAISGNVSASAPFDDTELPQVSALKSMVLRQSLSQSVTISLPSGTAFPTSFALSNITLEILLSDGTRSAQASATLAGPVTFTRQGTTSTYSATAPVEVSGITFQSTNFTSARDIITTAPSPNTASGKLSFDAESTQLPNGSTIAFTFSGGKAKVQL